MAEVRGLILTFRMDFLLRCTGPDANLAIFGVYETPVVIGTVGRLT